MQNQQFLLMIILALSVQCIFKEISQPNDTTCPTGQYYNQSKSQCENCSLTLSYCSACTSSLNCTKCENTLMIINSGKCDCGQGYYLDPSKNSSNACQACISHCDVCKDNSTCNQCNSGYTYNTSDKVCVGEQNELPSIFVSTNCTSVESCPQENYTAEPSANNSCWKASNGSNYYWFMNNNQSSGICYYYFSIHNDNQNCSLNFAYFPQLTILAGQDIQISILWKYTMPQYFTWKLPITFPDYNSGDGYYFGIIPKLQSSLISNLYIGSNDPKFQYQPCNYTFPNTNFTCEFNEFNYEINSSTYQYVKFYFSNPTANVILALMTGNELGSYDFNSQAEFMCSPGTQLIDHTCVDLSIINLSQKNASNLTNNQQYWNLSLTPFNGSTLNTFDLSIETSNEPGTFYLISENKLPISYISTTCNTTTYCQMSTPFPTQNEFCFTPEQNADAFYMNTQYPASIIYNYQQGCDYYFNFPDTNQKQAVVQMLYFQIQNISDSNQQDIDFPTSSKISLPRYTLYKLPSDYKQIDAQLINSFTVTINNVNSDLIENIYYSSNDTTKYLLDCSFNKFPNSTKSCSSLLIKNQNSISFTVNSVYSFNYLGFYAKVKSNRIIQQQNNLTIGQLSLEISSTVNCISGYYYSKTNGTCISGQSCQTGEYYDNSQQKCLNCSTSLSHCIECDNMNACTQCENTNFTLIAGECIVNCSFGMYPNPNATQEEICLPCQTNCFSCVNSSICERCNYGYFWDIKGETCTSFNSSIVLTNLSLQTQMQWELNATGNQQMFELTLPSGSLPGSFYWIAGEIYPSIYVGTNCSSLCEIPYYPSSSMHCFATPDDNQTAWFLNTDSSITEDQCFIQFYLQEDLTENKTFTFIYQPETKLNEGSNLVSLLWEPQIPRYFYYAFPNKYKTISNAKFNFTINNLNSYNFKTIYFGTNDTSYCNNQFPSYTNSCMITLSSWLLTSYSFVVDNPNSLMYVALVAGSFNSFDLFVTSSFQCFEYYEYSSQAQSCVSTYNCTNEQYYDSQLKKCVDCSNSIPNCLTCQNSSVCTSCINSGLYIQYGECEANCSNGHYTNPNLTTNSTNLCLDCLPNCFYCTNGTVCYTCTYPYTWDTEAGQCIKQSSSICNTGDYWNSTLMECIPCLKTLPYCQMCAQENYCSQCAKGALGGYITLEKGQCLVSCLHGNYPNPDKTSTNVCISCLPHCLQCTNLDSCNECYEPTYVWNAEQKQCKSICKIGEYYDSKLQSCGKCEVQYCTVCYGAGGQCNECRIGYRPVACTSAEASNQNYVCEKIESKKAGKLAVCAFLILVALIFI